MRPYVAPEALQLIKSTFDSKWIGAGQRVDEFEKAISAWIHNPNFLALNSCTSAITLALRIAGIGEGAEVISTPMTCVATNVPIAHSGARIVWADVSAEDGTISPTSIQGKITDKTRAIVMVHYGGYPCEIDEIRRIASHNNLVLIEDAAQALGSYYHGVPIGSHSNFVCFSFQSVKIVTTVDGGGIAFTDPERLVAAQKLRWFGIDRHIGNFLDSDIDDIGYRFTLNDVLASIGLANITHLPELLDRRLEIASIYSNELSSMRELKVCHPVNDSRRSSYYLFPILVPDKNRFIDMMNGRGIECSAVHRRNDNYTVFSRFRTGHLPGVDRWDQRMVCIPIGHWLNDGDIWHIVKSIKEGY